MSAGDFPVVVEREGVRARAVVKIGVMGVVVTIAAIGVSLGILRAGEGSVRPRALAAGASVTAAPPVIGSIEQTLVGDHARGLAARAQDSARLEGYAWIDADAGVASIPIERAMELVVLRHASDGGDAR